jgi:hypothetical protein
MEECKDTSNKAIDALTHVTDNLALSDDFQSGIGWKMQFTVPIL